MDRLRRRRLARLARPATEAQLDAHSAVFDEAELDFLGDALVLTFGGDYSFESGWRLDVAVSEDIAVESTSDVVFLFGLRRSW